MSAKVQVLDEWMTNSKAGKEAGCCIIHHVGKPSCLFYIMAALVECELSNSKRRVVRSWK